MRPFNQPGVADAARRYFLTSDGTPALQLQEEISIVQATSAPLDESPYGSVFRPCGAGTSKAPAGGEFTYIGVRPQASRVLQLTQLMVSNLDAAAATEWTLRGLTAANVTSIGVDNTSAMIDLNPTQMPRNVASNIWAGSFTASTTGTATGVGGVLLPKTCLVVPLREFGLCLWGNDPGGIPSFAVSCLTADISLRVQVLCREWPITP